MGRRVAGSLALVVAAGHDLAADEDHGADGHVAVADGRRASARARAIASLVGHGSHRTSRNPAADRRTLRHNRSGGAGAVRPGPSRPWRVEAGRCVVEPGQEWGCWQPSPSPRRSRACTRHRSSRSHRTGTRLPPRPHGGADPHGCGRRRLRASGHAPAPAVGGRLDSVLVTRSMTNP